MGAEEESVVTNPFFSLPLLPVHVLLVFVEKESWASLLTQLSVK